MGQVRVTLPHLPHGAYGPAKVERRTMLPWFCGLPSDHETLEVIGTWSDLFATHCDLVATRLSPSGLANNYGVIPFAFLPLLSYMALTLFLTRWSAAIGTTHSLWYRRRSSS